MIRGWRDLLFINQLEALSVLRKSGVFTVTWLKHDRAKVCPIVTCLSCACNNRSPSFAATTQPQPRRKAAPTKEK
jgi:hypothetical protein